MSDYRSSERNPRLGTSRCVCRCLGALSLGLSLAISCHGALVLPSQSSVTRQMLPASSRRRRARCPVPGKCSRGRWPAPGALLPPEAGQPRRLPLPTEVPVRPTVRSGESSRNRVGDYAERRLQRFRRADAPSTVRIPSAPGHSCTCWTPSPAALGNHLPAARMTAGQK